MRIALFLVVCCISHVPSLQSGNTMAKDAPDIELQNAPTWYNTGPWIEYMLEDVPHRSDSFDQERKLFGTFKLLKTFFPSKNDPSRCVKLYRGGRCTTQLYPERKKARATFYKGILSTTSNTLLSKMVYSCHKTKKGRIGILWGTTLATDPAQVHEHTTLLAAIEDELAGQGCHEIRAYCQSPAIDAFYEQQSYEIRNATLLFTKNLENRIKKKEQ